jgi:hypothetical protein
VRESSRLLLAALHRLDASLSAAVVVAIARPGLQLDLYHELAAIAPMPAPVASASAASASALMESTVSDAPSAVNALPASTGLVDGTVAAAAASSSFSVSAKSSGFAASRIRPPNKFAKAAAFRELDASEVVVVAASANSNHTSISKSANHVASDFEPAVVALDASAAAVAVDAVADVVVDATAKAPEATARPVAAASASKPSLAEIRRQQRAKLAASSASASASSALIVSSSAFASNESINESIIIVASNKFDADAAMPMPPGRSKIMMRSPAPVAAVSAVVPVLAQSLVPAAIASPAPVAAAAAASAVSAADAASAVSAIAASPTAALPAAANSVATASGTNSTNGHAIGAAVTATNDIATNATASNANNTAAALALPIVSPRVEIRAAIKQLRQQHQQQLAQAQAQQHMQEQEEQHQQQHDENQIREQSHAARPSGAALTLSPSFHRHAHSSFAVNSHSLVDDSSFAAMTASQLHRNVEHSPQTPMHHQKHQHDFSSVFSPLPPPEFERLDASVDALSASSSSQLLNYSSASHAAVHSSPIPIRMSPAACFDASHATHRSESEPVDVSMMSVSLDESATSRLIHSGGNHQTRNDGVNDRSTSSVMAMHEIDESFSSSGTAAAASHHSLSSASPAHSFGAFAATGDFFDADSSFAHMNGGAVAPVPSPAVSMIRSAGAAAGSGSVLASHSHARAFHQHSTHSHSVYASSPSPFARNAQHTNAVAEQAEQDEDDDDDVVSFPQHRSGRVGASPLSTSVSSTLSSSTTVANASQLCETSVDSSPQPQPHQQQPVHAMRAVESTPNGAVAASAITPASAMIQSTVASSSSSSSSTKHVVTSSVSSVVESSPVVPVAAATATAAIATAVATPSHESAAANWARKMKQAVKQQPQRGVELPAYLDSPVCVCVDGCEWMGVGVYLRVCVDG